MYEHKEMWWLGLKREKQSFWEKAGFPLGPGEEREKGECVKGSEGNSTDVQAAWVSGTGVQMGQAMELVVSV